MALPPPVPDLTGLLPRDVRSSSCPPRLLLINPHRIGKLVIINAPSSSSAFWATLKSWLTPEIAERFVVLGADYANALLDLVDAENLPASLGGTCTCDTDGGCEALAAAGPWMDGRAERRAQWLAGERPKPGVCRSPGKAKESCGSYTMLSENLAGKGQRR
jgi:CRAL/TRIO domain